MASAARSRARTARRSPSAVEAPARGSLAFLLPPLFALALAAVAFVPRIQANERLALSFFGAAAALLLGYAGLALRLGPALRSRGVDLVLRRQHWLQAGVQIAVYAYWGWFWRPVYAHAWLLVGQILFAYAFDLLLSWWRRERTSLGFGPFPIILSTNLFLWFRDDWFYLQFLMIAVGFLGKEFVRWERDGKRVHIFNPSAFTLGLFSLVLIATGTTELTWGQEIASTLTLAPHIYLFLFALGLVVMWFFSITLVAGTAALVLFGLSAGYAALTGVPWFLDSEIPAAVFLGLHLLVTDPSTSPRSAPGKALFGALYGVSVFGLYALLGAFGVPTFYDKLLAVPLLNLSVRGIDGLVRRVRSGAPSAAPAAWASARANLAFMSVWAVFFAAMTVLGRTDGRHVGDSLPFWEAACGEGRPNACARLLQLEATYCADNSAWACNELGAHHREGRLLPADEARAQGFFARACELRFQAACLNLVDPTRFLRSPPRTLDLRLLLREGGRNLMEMPEPELYERACRHQWGFACERQASTG
ncbi:MAG: hypothetical protein R3E98_00080 [Gemmatimonadota bacterium]